MKKSIIVIGIIMCVTVWGFIHKEKKSNDHFVREVTMAHAYASSSVQDHVFGATVENHDEAVLAAQIGGAVRSISVDEGERVEKGQVLVAISAHEYAAQYTRAQTLVEIAQKEEQLARRTWDDFKPEERARIKLGVTRAEALRAEAAAHLAKTRITAPFDGVVSTTFVQTGATVSPGTPIIRVVGDATRNDVVFDVSRDVVNNLSVGDDVEIAHGDKRGTAKVYAIDPVAHTQTRKVRVHAEVNGGADIVSGDFVEVHVAVPMNDGVVVPTASLVRFYDDDIVFVTNDDRVTATPVQVHSVDGQQAVVTGIADGDAVVVSGAQAVRDGDSVQVIADESL